MKTYSRLHLLRALLVCLLAGSSFLRPALRAQAPDANAGSFSNFQNTPVSSLLDTYEQLSGKHLIRDVTLTGLPPITLNANGVGKEEFLRLVEATLLLNGVAIVPVDADTAKVVNATNNAKSPRSEGVRLYANADDLPADDEVVSYYMPLTYLSAKDAIDIFTAHAPVHTYGAYVPIPSAQAVVLTESTSVVRELVALRQLIDVPPARVTSEFIQLNRADADKVAELLNKVLDEAKKGDAKGGEGASVPAGVGNQAPLSNEHNLLSGPAQIVPDARSNRLLVITRPVNLPFLRQMIAELDQSNSFIQPQRRALKYVLAGDILPALASALAQGKDEEEQAKAAAGARSAAESSSPSSNDVATTAQNPNAGSAGSGQTGTSSAATSGNAEPALSNPPQNNVPTIITIGKTRLVADNRSNSIIVFGAPDMVERVDDMIDQLDRKPLQVYLATVIGQLTVGQGMEFGVDILQKFQQTHSYGAATGLINTAAGGTAANVPEPSTLTSVTGFPLGSGLTIYGAIGNTVNAYVRALETTNRFKVISRPSVFTTNNRAALIASGSQVPVPASTTSGFTGSSTDLVTTSAIAYQNVLLQLSIIPVINANHQITLRIRQSNDSIGGEQVISGNSIPIIDTQKLDTEVTVPDRSTIVIGGLISDSTDRNTSGLPFISDIPLLGYLFKDTKKNKSRNELIIMIQPSVVETEGDQVVVNEAEKARTILGHEAEATGADLSAVPPGASVTTQTQETQVLPAPAPGYPRPAVTTTVTKSSPVSPTPSLVPAASSAAPDVGHAHLPADAPAVPPPTTVP